MKSEIPRLTLAAIAWAVADKIRFPAGLLSTFSYYRGEVEDFHAPHVSWITHVLVYPEVLLFSAAGVILCSLALLNISWRLRGSNVWMFLLWILIPLIVLTPIIKKNNYYVWTLAPAISLLAASVLSKFSLNLKKVWIIICFVFASFHMLHFASPLEGLVNPILFQENFSIKALSFPPSSKQQDMEVAHEVLKLAEKCGPLENRPLSFMQPPVLVPLNFYFCMLYLDRRPVYWFPVNVFIKTENATIVEMIEDKKRYSAKMWQEWENRLGSDYNELQKTHVVVYESSKYRVYCPKGSIEKQKAIEP